MTSTPPRVYQALSRALPGRAASVPWREFALADWQQFADAAQVERIAPLLCHSFRQQGWPAEMPERVRQFLLREFYNSAANSSLMFSELARVLSALEQSGIRAVILKGAALALTIYPDMALRPMGDLDLLIRPSDLKAAVDVVQGMGYKPETPPMRRGLEHLFFYEANFRGGDRALTQVELHWDLMGGEGSRYRPDIDWFWAQTKEIRIGNASALILSPTAHLLHAAVHLSLKHGGDETRLLWLYDLHLMISQCPDVNWQLLIDKAKDFHWLPVVDAVLNELTLEFSTIIPAWVFDACAHENDAETRLLVQRIAAARHTRTTGALAHLAFLSWTSRLRWLAAVVFPDYDYMRWRYKLTHAWLLPVCYFARWIDMVLDGMITLVRRMGIAFAEARNRSTEAD